jgi:cytoskeletal protein CcmA (bactofilin family)
MNNEKIDGIGTIHGGNYNDILVDGMGKQKGFVTAKKVVVSGAFKSKGQLTAEELQVDGIARIFRNIKINKLVIKGTLKLRHADVNADSVYGEGLLTSTGTICADEISINGYCTVKKIMGDRISIHNDLSGINRIMKRLRILAFLYFGRGISPSHSLVDQIECTNLTASGIKAKVVRAGDVELGRDCIIDRLYCDGNIMIDPTCTIRKIYTNNEVKEFRRKGRDEMANITVKKILDLYKSAAINEEEAELMLKSAFKDISSDSRNGSNDNVVETPWEEDGKLRLVAFIGRKLLKRGESGQNRLEFKYEGEALNVECYVSLTCGNISGSASAGGSISCKNIGSNASCGGSISCNDIGGNVSAGGSINKGF